MVYSGVRSGSMLENFDFGEPGAPVSMLELAADAERDEMRMFESVIELDFLEASRRAFNEADGEETGSDDKKKKDDEDASKSIFEKIKAAIKKAITFIKQFIANFIAKIKNFLANDRKLVHENEKYFKKEYLKEFKVTDYKEVVDISGYSKLDVVDGLNVKDSFKKFTSKEDIPDQKEINKNTAELFKLSGEDKVNAVAYTNLLNEDRKEHKGETKLVEISGEIERILAYMKDGKKLIGQAQRKGKDNIALLQNLEKDVNFDRKHLDDDLAVASANYNYCLTKSMVQAVSVIVSCTTSFMSRNLADARTTFVKACRYAKGKYDGKEDTANQESADLLGLASEMYCESVFDLV